MSLNVLDSLVVQGDEMLSGSNPESLAFTRAKVWIQEQDFILYWISNASCLS